VNNDVAEIGVRAQLRFSKANVGNMITFRTAKVGDDGRFALTQDPPQWSATGGVPAYVGNPSFAPEADPAQQENPGAAGGCLVSQLSGKPSEKGGAPITGMRPPRGARIERLT